MSPSATVMMFAVTESNGGAGRDVLVIGAGVSGLTSALSLARSGFSVTVVAEQFAPRVTSVVAGALWEWPPAVCGHLHGQLALTRAKDWCIRSYSIFSELSRDPATGVFLRPVTFYFRRPIAEDDRQRLKMEELRPHVGQFHWDSDLVHENGVNPGLGFLDAYRYLAPMIDTDAYMCWLLGEVRNAGCRVVERPITGRLREQADSLAGDYRAAAIVNCAGLGAGDLTGDEMVPLRGALVRVRNDGASIPRITEAHCVSNDGDGQGFIFIVPRGKDMLVLGGVAEPGESSLGIGLHNHAPIREMYERCLEFLPALRGCVIDAAEPVRVGLRPLRPQSVRVEVETGTRIVHNYGHGGSGVTFSWGCALEIVALVKQVVGPAHTSSSRSA